VTNNTRIAPNESAASNAVTPSDRSGPTFLAPFHHQVLLLTVSVLRFARGGMGCDRMRRRGGGMRRLGRRLPQFGHTAWLVFDALLDCVTWMILGWRLSRFARGRPFLAPIDRMVRGTIDRVARGITAL
jgi:hypothetical protein